MAAMLGGVLWIVLVAGVTFTHGLTDAPRDALILGFGTLEFNRLLVLPPLLFIVGLAGIRARGAPPRGSLERTGFVAALLGLFMVSLGVVLETWIVEPDTDFYNPVVQVGWMVYILGRFPVLAVGMALFGLASSGTERRLRIIVVSIGLLISLEFLAGVLSSASASLAWDLVVAILTGLVGLGWAVLGYILWAYRGKPARQAVPVG